MATGEVVYLARDNAIDLLLKADGVAVDLAPVTRVVVSDVGCAWEIDSAVSANAFDWTDGGGVLNLMFGDEPIAPGAYNCYLTLYDPTNPDGIVWGEKLKISFVVICSPEPEV